MKQGKTRDAFPRSNATINQALGATPSRAAKAERDIEREALTNMGFDAEYLYWAGMEDIGCK